jgi:hypothetical protein
MFEETAAVQGTTLVRYEWTDVYCPDTRTCSPTPSDPCPQDSNHLWVWHDCRYVLPADSVAPGEFYGWRASGVSLHTVITPTPLTLVASLYWPDCCGLHGFITEGAWISA